MGQTQHTNRLIEAESPYLRQHAHNPVDWEPWSPQALARARREDKPILLSIGYSACHWCHVMAHESFEDEAIARLMNEHFVSIKVDREERPDLDDLYMTAVQMLTGSGGWPLNVFLTPDLKPFYGGTYFPPHERWGRPGFADVLRSVARAYRERRADIEESAEGLAQALIAGGVAGASGAPGPELIAEAVASLKADFDDRYGGFGHAPKFPQSTAFSLLLRHVRGVGDEDARHMLTLTLDRMAEGGLYDQLGGGFHRYSVDRKWLVPHFEKMLYDNALLTVVYLDAFSLTGRPPYRRVAQETLDYMLREMADEGGGFHSAQDADSEGEEGRYYVWERGEIGELPGGDAELFRRCYGVTEKGNFEGRNILHLAASLEEAAAQEGLLPADLQARLDAMRRRLLEARAKRVPPGKDDKVLTDWNALAISALARGYQVLGEDAYRAAAERAARFLLDTLWPETGLLHAYCLGHGYVDAFLDDWAFLLQASIDLYQATFDLEWITVARRLADEMVARFRDPRDGGLFLSPPGQADLLVRAKHPHDSATPAGSAVAALSLMRLGKLTGTDGYRRAAEECLAATAGAASKAPRAFCGYLCALGFHLGPTREVVVVGPRDDANAHDLVQAVGGAYLPNAVIAALDPSGDMAEATRAALPLTDARPPVNGRAAVHVCDERGCLAPLTAADELTRVLAV